MRDLCGEVETDQMEALAKIEFEAISIELKEARATYVNHWSGIAVALVLMTKTPDECREIVAGMEKDDSALEDMIEGLSSTRKWLKDTEKVVEIAMARLCCGMARQGVHAD